MNNEELRAQLETAKAFKAEQVTKAKSNVEGAKQRLKEQEDSLAQWTTMAPFDVLEFMAEQSRRDAAEAEETERHNRLDAIHAAALHEAHELHKGILPPQAATKSTTFGLSGALLGGVLGVYIASFHVGVRGELGLTAIGIICGIAGLFAGIEFFSRNFVIDESLERSPLHLFTAHKIVRRTYFKNARD